MEVEYRSKRIEKICTDASYAEKKYSREMAEKIQSRVDQIKSLDTVEQMIQFRVGRCHQLKGNRRNQFAVDLVGAYRLVFEKKGSQVQIALITEIVDYH